MRDISHQVFTLEAYNPTTWFLKVSVEFCIFKFMLNRRHMKKWLLACLCSGALQVVLLIELRYGVFPVVLIKPCYSLWRNPGY